MSDLFKKLNLKDQDPIVILNAPDSFNEELNIVKNQVKVFKDIDGLKQVDFALIFVFSKDQIEMYIKQICPLLIGDVVLWFAYPKGSSKKYNVSINRDNGWHSLGKCDMEGVRQVSIDADWSALRFRKLQYIKSLKRREGMRLTNSNRS